MTPSAFTAIVFMIEAAMEEVGEFDCEFEFESMRLLPVWSVVTGMMEVPSIGLRVEELLCFSAMILRADEGIVVVVVVVVDSILRVSSKIRFLRCMTLSWAASKLCKNVPWGKAHFLIRSAEAEAKENSVGCAARALTPFLWCVRVVMVRPVEMSHKRTVESMEAVMTCGSHSAVRRDMIVLVCPAKTWTVCFVRISQTRAVPSLPAVTRTSKRGCN